MITRVCLVAFVLVSSAVDTAAQTRLTKLGQCRTTAVAVPRDYTEVGQRSFFVATSPASGRELWVTDGTEVGTRVVRDIRVGTRGSDPQQLTAATNQLFFVADDGDFGRELWRSDGTARGTKLVKDIWPGTGTSSVSWLAAVGNRVFFNARTAAQGEELWVSDGTSAGTYLVKDIVAGPSNSRPERMTAFGSRVVFYAAGKLWISDGTSLGTTSLITGHVTELATMGSHVYVTRTESRYGYELWRTDGTSAGTTLVKDITSGPGGSNPKLLTPSNGRLFFMVNNSNRQELWESDGSAAGTRHVTTLPSAPNALIATTDRVYFSLGRELWGVSGRPAVARLIRTVPVQSSIGSLTAVGSMLFFAYGPQLWRSNGQPQGTALVHTSTTPGIDRLAAFRGRLLFSAGNRAVWSSLGTSATTKVVRDLGVCVDTGVGELTAWNGNLAFAGDERVWTTTGHAPRVASARITGGPSHLSVQSPSSLLFVGNRYAYRTDGSSAKTLSSRQEFVNCASTAGGNAYFGSTVYVYLLQGSSLNAMWGLRPKEMRTEGPNLYTISSNNDLSENGRRLMGAVSGYDVRDGILYATDGRYILMRSAASSSTVLSPAAIDAGRIHVFGRRAVYSGAGELWITDGTASGSKQLKDINAGFSRSEPRGFATVGSSVLFAANDGKVGDELWITDGTTAGTRLVKDVLPGAESSSPQHITSIAAGTRAVFAAGTIDHGVEVWITDGTAAGTRRLTDIAKGPASSNPHSFVHSGRFVYFVADDGVTGEQLWNMSTWTLEIAALQPYGLGCFGRNGRTTIETKGAPTLGDSSFAIGLKQGRANAPALLVIGAQRRDIDLGNGCTKYFIQQFAYLGTRTNAAGRASLALPVPNNPSLIKGYFVAQFAVDDPVYGAWQAQTSLSNGLEVMVGR